MFHALTAFLQRTLGFKACKEPLHYSSLQRVERLSFNTPVFAPFLLYVILLAASCSLFLKWCVTVAMTTPDSPVLPRFLFLLTTFMLVCIHKLCNK